MGKNAGRADSRTTGDGNGRIDWEGRTYRVRLKSVAWVPYYFANQQVNEVSLLTDELTGDEVMIVWSKVGVVRKIA